MLNGLLLMDKPSGMTSHDVVDAVRNRLGMRRVGHAGTLDPLATGLLVILVGSATKRAAELMNTTKSYCVTMRCGLRTDTGDLAGRVVEQVTQLPVVSEEQIRMALQEMIGVQQQVPPMFSAVRVGGRRLYEWARRGVEVDRAPRTIVVHDCRLVALRWPDIELSVECSKGTYVRTLCETIGRRLGVPAVVASLRRVRCGDFLVDEAKSWDQLMSASAQVVAQWLYVGEDRSWYRCAASAA